MRAPVATRIAFGIVLIACAAPAAPPADGGAPIAAVHRSPFPIGATGLPIANPSGGWHVATAATSTVSVLNVDMKMTLHEPALRFRALPGQKSPDGYFVVVPVAIEVVAWRLGDTAYLGAAGCAVKDESGARLESAVVSRAFFDALNAALGLADLEISESRRQAVGVLLYRSATAPASLSVDCTLPYRGPSLEYPPERIVEWQPR